jgi:Domain of unknown function (DUF4124)
MKINSIVFLTLFSFSCTTQSEVYKHVDENGNVTYSNTPLEDSKKLSLPPLIVMPGTDLESKSRAPKPSENYNENQRKVVKKMIADEVKLLEDKKKEYNDGEPERFGSERNYQRYLDRIQRLKDEIVLHQENIKALEIELQDLASPN